VIQAHGLVKLYGGRKVLRDVDLDLEQGQCMVIVGSNGVGKTTLLRVLAGLVRPSSGTACIAGFDVAQDPISVRRMVGFVSHQPLLYEDLSAMENLRFYGKLYSVSHLDARTAELLKQMRLWARRDDPVRIYSRGMRQRLSIARALLHSPPVLLFDEPYTGLDQGSSQALDSLLNMGSVVAEPDQRGAMRTILLTTHSLDDALRAQAEFSQGRRVAILADGRIVYCTAQGSEDSPARTEAIIRLRTEYDRWMAADAGLERRSVRAQ